VLALDGAFVVASVVWMPVLSSRFNRRFARWCRARLLQRGYEELTLDVVLPGGVGWLTVKVYPPLIAAGPVFITGHDAWELKRHHDGACRHLLTNDPDEPTPIQLRFHVLPRHRGIELTTGSRLRAASRGRWYAGHERRTPEGRRGLPSGAAGVRTPTGPLPAAGFVWLSDDAVAHLSLDLAPRPRSSRLVACAGR
jgi:hypothetical protein